MCGIIACFGVKSAAEVLYGGLEALEYRGYDSAGISVLCRGEIKTVKRKGRVGALKPHIAGVEGGTGIGHTRWATHGRPSDSNAHPHAAGRFSVVHNGIIENCTELRAELVAEGYAFRSDTDSEVVVHLLNKYWSGDIKQAVLCAVHRLKGAFALAILCAGFDGFVAVKYRNPIIVGSGGGGKIFAASDMPALSGLAKDCAVLADGQIAFCCEQGVRACDFQGREVKLVYSPVPAMQDDGGLGGYSHYMAKEIAEIPRALRDTSAAFLSGGCADKLRELYALSPVGQIMLCGCGTAYHATLSAARYMEQVLGIPVRAETSGEFRYRKSSVGRDSLFIAVSQSGETADTVEAARAAKAAGARVIAVSNVPYSALNGIAQLAVPVCAGAEICVAATKSYCAQIAALYLIASALSGGEEAAAEEVCAAAASCKEVIGNTRAEGLARMCAGASGVYFIGRGADYPVALEGSLKLKEVSYVPGEGYPAGELKHGTIALIDGSAVAVVVITDSSVAAKTLSAVEQICSRGGRVAAVCSKSCDVDEIRERAAYIAEIPDCPPPLSPAVAVIPLQLLAYHTAVYLGRDPDKPRNLAKSVTVE